jgi:hypothetical protein
VHAAVPRQPGVGLGNGVAKLLLVIVVPPQQTGLQVGVPDYVVGGLGQQPEPVLLPLAFGNVAHDRLDGRFALVGNRGGRGFNVNGLPVEARDFLLHQRHGLSPVGAVQAVLHGFPVIGVGKVEDALADQLTGVRGAEQFGGGRVGKYDFAVHVDDRAVEQLHEHPVPFLGLLQRFLRLPDRFVFLPEGPVGPFPAPQGGKRPHRGGGHQQGHHGRQRGQRRHPLEHPFEPVDRPPRGNRLEGVQEAAAAGKQGAAPHQAGPRFFAPPGQRQAGQGNHDEGPRQQPVRQYVRPEEAGVARVVGAAVGRAAVRQKDAEKTFHSKFTENTAPESGCSNRDASWRRN